ncbi:MAG: hypothetical protein ACR2NP_01185 [Pirellulaceae bacterium]
MLRWYDLVVPGWLSERVWRCPASQLDEMYERFSRPRHLDIGVGTGFYLQRLLNTDWNPCRLILADANPDCLEYASRQLADVPHETVQIDVLDLDPQLAARLGTVESIAANFLLHCLPHGIASADGLADLASEILVDDGIFFGSTITGEVAGQQPTSRRVMRLFNRLHIFGNRGDNVYQLQMLLSSRFAHCRIRSAGCVTMFAASNAPLAELPE